MAKQKKPSQSRYIDGFVLVVPKKNLKAYQQMASQGAKIWRKCGALDYVEAVGDDLKPKGAMFTFPKAMRIKAGETVVFAYITYKSRVHRDQVNAKVMKSPLMNNPEFKDKPMPFDMKRMAYGGFEIIAR